MAIFNVEVFYRLWYNTCVSVRKGGSMIQPIKAIASRTMMSNPIALNPQMTYKNSMNFASRGEKLNIDCNEVRSITKNGQKLDIMA